MYLPKSSVVHRLILFHQLKRPPLPELHARSTFKFIARVRRHQTWRLNVGEAVLHYGNISHRILSTEKSLWSEIVQQSATTTAGAGSRDNAAAVIVILPQKEDEDEELDLPLTGICERSTITLIAAICYLHFQDMSTVASQLVLHPYVSQSLKYGGTNVGRDKLYRAVQYFSRLLAWFLLSRGNKEEAARWNALKNHLALGRKLMRLGKPIEHLQAALRAAQSPVELGEQLATVGRQLAYFGYLTYDAVIWANAVKLIQVNPSTSQRVAKVSNRFWLTGILLSITHGLLKAGRLAHEAKRLRTSQSWGEKDLGDEAQREIKMLALEKMRADTRFQFIIDILDVWIPASNLGLVNVNDGVVGLGGFISSLMGISTQWAAVNGSK